MSVLNKKEVICDNCNKVGVNQSPTIKPETTFCSSECFDIYHNNISIIDKNTKILTKLELKTLKDICIGLKKAYTKEDYNKCLFKLDRLSSVVKKDLNDIQYILKENPLGNYGEGEMLVLGEYQLLNMPDYPDGSKSFYIQIEDAEGGQFSIEKFIPYIKDFFNKYF